MPLLSRRRAKTAEIVLSDGGIVSELLPVDFAVTGAGEVEPDPGWLYCNGAAVSRTKYKRLFDIIGTAYGAGDTTTTFNLPDYRGRSITTNTDGATTVRITGNTRGATGGQLAVTLTKGNIPRHVHGAASYSISGGDHGHGHSLYYELRNNGGGSSNTLMRSDMTGFTEAVALVGSLAAQIHSHGNATIAGSSAVNGAGTSHTNVPPIQAAGAVLIRY